MMAMPISAPTTAGRQGMKMTMKSTPVALALLIALAWPGLASGQSVNPCGPLHTDHYGPYDYRTERTGKLRIVESSHFTPEIESLAQTLRGRRIYPEININYTLLSSPNHHRALIAAIRLGERYKSPQVPGMDYPVECFLERGLRFQPNDTVVRVLYARYLGGQKRAVEGIALLDGGVQYLSDNPLSHYNFGLAYLDLGAHEQALRQAHKAAELGFPRTELSDALKRLGKWREPGQ